MDRPLSSPTPPRLSFLKYLEHRLHPSRTQADVSTEDNISNAITTNNVPTLRLLLETQDR